jgi:hypothetical protein
MSRSVGRNERIGFHIVDYDAYILDMTRPAELDWVNGADKGHMSHLHGA